jgi:hypothetical protein
MKKEELSAWLFENGGPIIRYRTATELMPSSEKLDIKRLTDDLLRSPQVQKWLKNLVPPRFLSRESPGWNIHVSRSSIMDVHGPKPTVLETVLGKLTDFGLKKGIPELDRRTLPYRKWLEERGTLSTGFDYYTQKMAAAFLSRAGYSHETAIGAILKHRLNTIYEFVRKGDYDIYVPGKLIRTLPLIRPELAPNGIAKLPMIYDIIGWAAYFSECGTKEDWAKVGVIISHIFNERYQKFSYGYGSVNVDDRRNFGLGWSVHLPRFGVPEQKGVNKSVVQMISLLINFKFVRQHRWLKEAFEHLEGFRTSDGTYLFSGKYLEERPEGYWVSGYHMGLGEPPKTRRVLEVESTFWMAKFHKLLSNSIQVSLRLDGRSRRIDSAQIGEL